MKPLEINLVSDIHYYPESSGSNGSAYRKALAKSQKLLHGAHPVIEQCFSSLGSDSGADNIIIAGDLTNNGERSAHNGVIALLKKLKDSGKNVYVITATHDYRECGYTSGYNGDSEIKVPTCKRDELFDLYRQFGADNAVAVHRQSMSYVVQLADGYRLFALNDDMNLSGKSGFSDECFSWITEQVKKAEADGQFIIAFSHHPLISPSPVYSLIGKNDMMGDWEIRREQLADMGVHFIITGHTHMQGIRTITSKNGNVFYDISVPSPIGYPGTYKKLICDKDKNEITVRTVEFAKQSTLMLDGVPLYRALEKQLTGMITDVVAAAATDRNKFASMATAFSIKEDMGRKIGFVIKPAAKWINTVTAAKIAKKVKKSSGLTANEIEKLKSEKAIDIIIRLMLNLFDDNGKYTKDTPEYKLVCAVLGKLDRIAGFLHIPLSRLLAGSKNLTELIKPLLFGGTDSENDVIISLDEK